MRMAEFEQLYCSDIIKKAGEKKKDSKLVDWTKLPYQEIYEDEDGNRYPCVWVDDVPIYNRDFLEMSREEFLDVHKTPNAGEYFDRYTSDFEFREGSEVFFYYQRKAKEEKQKLQEEVDIASSMLL